MSDCTKTRIIPRQYSHHACVVFPFTSLGICHRKIKMLPAAWFIRHFPIYIIRLYALMLFTIVIRLCARVCVRGWLYFNDVETIKRAARELNQMYIYMYDRLYCNNTHRQKALEQEKMRTYIAQQTHKHKYIQTNAY